MASALKLDFGLGQARTNARRRDHAHRLGWRRVRLQPWPSGRVLGRTKASCWGGHSALQVQKIEEPCLLIKHIDAMLKLWAEDLHSAAPGRLGSGNAVAMLVETKGELIRGTELLDESADIRVDRQ